MVKWYRLGRGLLMFFTDIATVYNYYIDANGNDAWKRTVISGVQWRHQRIITSPNGTTEQRSKAESLTIDFAHEWLREGYVTPKAFNSLTDKSGVWTLNDESGHDVVVFGESPHEISNGFKLSQLHEIYDWVGTVTEVADNRNRNLLKNIKVILQ